MYPYTEVLPKPLIPVNDSTILENIINQFMLVGCRKFYLSVNYKKNLIKAYLNELNWEAQIFYIEEEQYLGTCGSLKYLEDVLEESFIVTNCDILIEADYADIVSYHKVQQNDITVVAASKAVQFPYGVLRTDGNARLDALDEKPVFNFLINTGFYVLEPQVLAYIPKEKELHMTQLIKICRNRQKKIGIYSIPDAAWMDMGEMEQLDKMLAKMRGERYNGN